MDRAISQAALSTILVKGKGKYAQKVINKEASSTEIIRTSSTFAKSVFIVEICFLPKMVYLELVALISNLKFMITAFCPLKIDSKIDLF